MKFHKSVFLVFLLASLSSGCAIDGRTGKALADALSGGPIRDYASVQADAVAQTCMVLQQQAAPVNGGPPELDGARMSWLKARAAYDRGVAVFLVVAPDLDFQLDGHLDDIFARTGLRQVEAALFAMPPAPPSQLVQLTTALSGAAVALHGAVPDSGRPLPATALIGSMSAVAAQLAAKLDGTISPYADASVVSVESNLVGLQQMYLILSPVVSGPDPGLDQKITGLLQVLLAQVHGRPSFDDLTDKPLLLRKCAELSQALRQIGTALGLVVTTVNLS